MAKTKLVIDINRKEEVLVVSSYSDDTSDKMTINQSTYTVDEHANDQTILLDAFGSVLENLDCEGSVTVVIPQLVAIRLFQALKHAKETRDTEAVFSALYADWMEDVEGMTDAVRHAINGIIAAQDRGISLRIVSALSLYSHRLKGDDAAIAALAGKKIKIDNSIVISADGEPVSGVVVRDNNFVTGEFSPNVTTITSRKGETRHEATIPRYYKVRKDGATISMTGFEVSADMSVDGTSDSIAHAINMIRLHVTSAAALPRKVVKTQIQVVTAEG